MDEGEVIGFFKVDEGESTCFFIFSAHLIWITYTIGTSISLSILQEKEDELQEKENELSCVILKEMKSNGELQEARRALIEVWMYRLCFVSSSVSGRVVL